jgi:hypothetical protein
MKVNERLSNVKAVIPNSFIGRPLEIADDKGELIEQIGISSIAGGARYIEGMPADLELIRYFINDGAEIHQRYVQEDAAEFLRAALEVVATTPIDPNQPSAELRKVMIMINDSLEEYNKKYKC